MTDGRWWSDRREHTPHCRQCIIIVSVVLTTTSVLIACGRKRMFVWLDGKERGRELRKEVWSRMRCDEVRWGEACDWLIHTRNRVRYIILERAFPIPCAALHCNEFTLWRIWRKRGDRRQIPAERLGPMALTDDVIRHRCNVKKKNERAATTETNGICYFDVTRSAREVDRRSGTQKVECVVQPIKKSCCKSERR